MDGPVGKPEDHDADRAVDMILAAPSMVVRVELGIQQSRHSTLNSYLEKLLYLLTGNFGRRGTNGLHTWLQPLFEVPACGQSCLEPTLLAILTPLGAAAALAFIVVGLIDVPIQRGIVRAADSMRHADH